MFRIRKHNRDAAKRLGVTIKPSTVKGKKLDVFKKGKKVASIGAVGYMDYASYLAQERAGKAPKRTAAKRRKAYKKRHAKDRMVRGSNGYYADQVLW